MTMIASPWLDSAFEDHLVHLFHYQSRSCEGEDQAHAPACQEICCTRSSTWVFHIIRYIIGMIKKMCGRKDQRLGSHSVLLLLSILYSSILQLYQACLAAVPVSGPLLLYSSSFLLFILACTYKVVFCVCYSYTKVALVP